MQLAFEQRYRKLKAMGLFDEERKQKIPEFPRKIGVVTSPAGAALQDIINVLSRRYPIARLLLAPALVQGEQASDSLIQALIQLEKQGCDVIILARGGVRQGYLVLMTKNWSCRLLYVRLRLFLPSDMKPILPFVIMLRICARQPPPQRQSWSVPIQNCGQRIDTLCKVITAAMQKYTQRYQNSIRTDKNRFCFNIRKNNWKKKPAEIGISVEYHSKFGRE